MDIATSKIEEFCSKVNFLALNGCWEWRGTIISSGYGSLTLPKRKYPLAHRFGYEYLVGKIPEGLQLDHLCRNKICVNPMHLEPVTQRENILRSNSVSAIAARKTHCPSGHPYIDDNLTNFSKKRGTRSCRICKNAWMREYDRVKKANAIAN